MINKDVSKLVSRNDSVLLSIAIPSKNRYETLIPVLDALLEHIVDDDYEIVVQDNSDDTQLINEWVAIRKDYRVKYFHQKGDFSQSENSSLAIDNCSGDYIIFIGDDDFVSPYICNVVREMKQQQINSLIYTPGNYYWEGISFSKCSYLYQCQMLYLPHRIFNTLIKKKSVSELKKFLNAGAVLIERLPKLYHGIVRKNVLDKIKNKWGTYFPGSSPDMASSIALLLTLDSYYYVSYPASITGVSVKSAAGLGAKGTHVGKIEDQKHLPKNILQTWDEKVPKIWTGPSIYAQTASEVLGNNSAYKINYFVLYAYMLIYHPDLRPYIKEAIKKINTPSIIKESYILYYLIQLFLKRCIGKIRRTVGIYPLRGYKNMSDVDICMKYMKETVQLNI